MKNKIIASVMAVTMVFGAAFSISAYAEDVETTFDETVTASYDAEGSVNRRDQLINELTITPRITAVLKDGTEVDLGKVRDTNDKKIFVDIVITKDQLVSALKNKGKTLDDVDNFMSYLNIGYTGKDLKSYNAVVGYQIRLGVKSGDKTWNKATEVFMSEAYVTPLELKEYRLDQQDANKAMFAEYYDGSTKRFKLDEIDEYYFDIAFLPEVRNKIDPDKKITKGDANGDSKVNVADIAAIASYIKGIKALKGDSLKAADVNGDGNVNVADIAMIASHIKGIKALS